MDEGAATLDTALIDPACGGGDLVYLQPAFLPGRGVARVLAGAGWHLSPGWPLARAGRPATAAIAAWGRRRPARPAMALAQVTGRRLLSVEEGWLSSIGPRAPMVPPASLLLDDVGIAIDPSRPSRLERLIAASTRATPAMRARAEAGLARLRALGLSKQAPVARRGAPPQSLGSAPYVLVVDQVAGDASVRLCGAGGRDFDRMLRAAIAENPGVRVVVKGHPDPRRGYLCGAALPPGVVPMTAPVNAWDIVEGADAVYTVSSQLGYEALLAERPVHVFGQPFYAGWGLTLDRRPLTPDLMARRRARPDRLALFAASHLLYPLYWDPHDGAPCRFEDALDMLEARLPTERPDGPAPVFLGVARWKRPAMARFHAATQRPPRHCRSAEAAIDFAAREGRDLWAWASSAPADLIAQASARGVRAGLIEDGFLRSVGLGARLTDPASLIFDRDGIHYDPARPSGLETLVAQAAGFAPDDPRLARAAALLAAITSAGVTKYNLPGAAVPDLPLREHVILVPGQVADDASLSLGCAGAPAFDDEGLLAAARAAHPDAYLLYKPHPDVEAGLRRGGVPAARLAALADGVATAAPAAALLSRVGAVWTLTSTLGFEALLRGLPVTCLGVPFYAGWGLTRDLGPVPARRTARPGLEGLVWAALIAYPRYVHPTSGLGCTPERLVAHLAAGHPAPAGGPMRRAMSLAQDALGSLGLVRWR
ncbi:MAG: capsular polysaccharide biosynthesis protein [Pseudomonadota bacterium]